MPVAERKPETGASVRRQEFGRNSAANTTRAPIEIFRTSRDSTKGLVVHERTLRVLDLKNSMEAETILPLRKVARESGEH